MTSAVQIFLPNTVGLVMLTAMVVRASGQSDAYLTWVVFFALAVTGAGMILYALRVGRLGSGRLVVANFNVPFLAICGLALEAGGPSLLATLLVVSALFQIVLSWRLSALRRVFSQTVSGIVVMLVAVSAVPFIIRNALVVPEGTSTALFLAPGLAALAAGALIALRGAPVWRAWILPVTAAVGLIVAAPLGFYDTGGVADTPWLGLPGLPWPGLDLGFGAEFWALLPVFVFVNIIGLMKAVGDLSIIHRASYRDPVAVDFRSVQGGLTAYGLTNLCSGLLGTLPVGAPWSVTAVFIGFTGVAAASVGVYLGLLTMLGALLAKLIAVLAATPSPVLSAVYVIIFGMLFIEGAKTAAAGFQDQKQAAITGISMVLGLSAGAVAGLFGGAVALLAGNPICLGGAAAIVLTAVSELSGFRARKLRVDFSPAALPAVDSLILEFADRHAWTEEATGRLRLVGEEAALSLLDEEIEGAADLERTLVASIRRDGGAAELELVVVSDDAIEGNIEERIAYLGEAQALEDERQLSVRILRHYASSVHHRKYYGMDIVSCRVDRSVG